MNGDPAGTGAEQEDREWAADKRAFVADARDAEADVRDRLADARDAVADERESLADVREAGLDERDRTSGTDAAEADGDDSDLTAIRAQAGADRAAASEDRAEDGRRRAARQGTRDEAAQRRRVEDEPTRLALVFAGIAEQLYQAESYDDVLARICEAAVATLAGGDAASVTLEKNGHYRTAGATSQTAADLDQEQYDADEGPGLDALATPLVDAPAFPDDRWPVLGERPGRHGVESSLSYQLDTADGDDAGSASLNIYAQSPAAFDQAARDAGIILAAHASLAARAVGERASLKRVGEQLEKALLSRDVIGQAKGILMERLKTTPEEAFDILRRTSQHLNRKLREVAAGLTGTGDLQA